MGAQSSRPSNITIERSTKSVLLHPRSRSRSSLVDMLLSGRYDEVLECINQGNQQHEIEQAVSLIFESEQDNEEGREGGDEETRKRANKPLKRQVLPIHVACALPDIPLQVIQELVKAHPKSLLMNTALPSTSLFSSLRKRSQLHRSVDALASDNHSMYSGVSSHAPTRRSFMSSSRNSFTALSVHTTASYVHDDDAKLGENQPWGIGWLPIHIATYYGLPHNIIHYLLQEAPMTLFAKTSQGLLPLHLGCILAANTGYNQDINDKKNNEADTSKQLISFLVQQFPASIHIPTTDGFLPYELLATTSRKASYVEGIRQILSPSAATTSISNNNSSSAALEKLAIKVCVHSIPCPSLKRPRDYMFYRYTKLFKAISLKSWGYVLERIQRRPREAAIWTLLAQQVQPNDPPCHQLPLHLALRRKAPPQVIFALLDAYPDAKFKREMYGMWPLHIGAEAGATLDVMIRLGGRTTTTTTTSGNASKDSNEDDDAMVFLGTGSFDPTYLAQQPCSMTDMLPLHLACASHACRVDVIKYLLELFPQAMHVKDAKGYKALDYIKNSSHPHSKQIKALFQYGVNFWDAKPIRRQREHSDGKDDICQPQDDDGDYNDDNYSQELDYSGEVEIPIEHDDARVAQCLINRNWNGALDYLQRFPQQAATWTMYKGRRYLPLHYACLFRAPTHVVEALLDQHVYAASQPCQLHGMLPLHLSVTNPHIVRMLLRYYPHAASTKDDQGLLPLHLAVTRGAPLQVLQTLIDIHPGAVQARDFKGYTPLVYAKAQPQSKRVMDLLSYIEEDKKGTVSKNKNNSRSNQKVTSAA